MFTREKLIRIATRAIERHQGKTPLEQATAIADVIEAVMESETEAGTTTAKGEPIIDWPIQTDAPKPASPQQGPSPSPNSSSMIVLPDSKEARETLKQISASDPRDPRAPAPAAIKLRQISSKPIQQKIELPDLIKRLEAATPERITITVEHPERGTVNIPLDRNILAEVVGGAVKLLYKHPNYGDDMAASHTFFCQAGKDEQLTEADFDFNAALEKIRQDAVNIYSPRKRHIQSSTPVMFGGIESMIRGAPAASADQPMSSEEAALFSESAGRHLDRPVLPHKPETSTV